MSAEQVGGKPVPFLIPAIFNRSKLMSSLWFYPGLQEHLPNSCQMCSAPRGSSMRLSCGFLPETSQGYTAEVSNMAKLKGPAASPSQQKNPKDPLHPGTRSLGAAFPPKTMTAFSLVRVSTECSGQKGSPHHTYEEIVWPEGIRTNSPSQFPIYV